MIPQFSPMENPLSVHERAVGTINKFNHKDNIKNQALSCAGLQPVMGQKWTMRNFSRLKWQVSQVGIEFDIKKHLVSDNTWIPEAQCTPHLVSFRSLILVAGDPWRTCTTWFSVSILQRLAHELSRSCALSTLCCLLAYGLIKLNHFLTFES